MAVSVSVINVLEQSSTEQPKQHSNNANDNENRNKAITLEELTDTVEVIELPDTIIKHKDDMLDVTSRKEPKNQNVRESEEMNDSKTASYWNGFHALSILIVCIVNTATITLIPRHDSLEHPEYWYEIMILYIFGFVCRTPFGLIMVLYFFTNTRQLLSFKNLCKVFIFWSLAYTILYCTCCLIWNVYLNNYHPMPFIGLLGHRIPAILRYFFAIFLFPIEMRKKELLKKQLLYWIGYDLWFIIVLDAIQFQLISVLLNIISTEYQWLLAIFIPIFKVANTWIVKRFIQRTPEANIKKLNFLATTEVTIDFANYLATRISSLDKIAVYGIFTIDLLLHVHGCYKIINLSTKIQDEGSNTGGTRDTLATEQNERVINLVTSEFIETFVPVAFGIGFATAFYGPNAELLKNVKNDYFGGKVLEDITEFYIPLCLMFAFDVLGVIFSAASLRYFCNINLFEEFCKMMKEYWFVFMILLPAIALSFGTRDVNLGIDLTMKFLWTTEEGRAILFGNSTKSLE